MKRPRSVLLFGVLNLIFGVVGLYSGVTELFESVFIVQIEEVEQKLEIESHRQFADPEETHVTYVQGRDEITAAGVPERMFSFIFALIMVSAFVDSMFSLMLLASGFGLLTRKAWARRLCIRYAVMRFILVPLPIAAALLTVGYPMSLQSMSGNLFWVYMIAIPLAGVLTLAYPSYLWYCMTRREVKAWFEGQVEVAAAGTPAE